MIMHSVRILLFLCGLAVAAPASAADWAVDPAASHLSLTATQAGSAFDGEFTGWSAAIRFDPTDPAAARLSVDIPLTGLRTGDSMRDNAAAGTDWFDMARFPAARYQADGFQPLGDGRYLARGSLRLRGIERPLDLTFTLSITDGTAKAQGSASLSRLAYGVGQGEWAGTDIVGDRVDLRFFILARESHDKPNI